MHSDVILEPSEKLSPPPGTTGAGTHGVVRATSTTINAAEPRERVRGMVAARLFGPLATPSRVGRFTLQRELGVGGVGAVYAAHDPRLDRVIAVKILQQRSSDSEASQRLLREAQAMARLRHPNVVQIYEVGTHGGQVHIAMELIEGGTLREWMDGRPRPWAELREVMLAAGRGLAAAHAAGLIHRDFKPGNVLIDIDGQPRVSDFGLARTTDERSAPADEAERTDELDQVGLLEVALTRTGAVLGTPAYMSPEQIRGEPSTSRSDQFAYCVVVWEALCGERPFLAQSMGGLLHRIESGQLGSPQGLRPPRKLRRILERGLSRRPSDRYPSMLALLTALERIHQGRRSRLWITSLMAASMVAGATMFLVDKDRSRADEKILSQEFSQLLTNDCLKTQQFLTRAWGPASREGMRASLAAAEGTTIADPRISGVLDTIHRRVESLQETTSDRCLAMTENVRLDDDLWGCHSDRIEEFVAMLAAVERAENLELREVEGLISMVSEASECEGVDPYISPLQAPAERAERWDARRSIAWAFAPGASSPSSTAEPKSWAHAAEVAARLKDKRLTAEVNFTEMVAAARGGATSVDASVMASFERATAGFDQKPFPRSGPIVDLRARVAVLRLGLHDRSSREEHEELSAEASAALDRLPPAHELRLRLSRELAEMRDVH